MCPSHGHRGTYSPLRGLSPGGGTATWCPRRGFCFLSNLRADLGHAEEATPPRGEPGLRRPLTPRATAIPSTRPPASRHLPPWARLRRSDPALALRAGGTSSRRGTGVTAGPSTVSPPPPPPPPPRGEAGRAPAVPPQPTPGRAFTPRPGPASITSRSTFERLPPAAAALLCPRLVLSSGGTRQRCPSGTASPRSDSPSRGCSRPCRGSVARRGGGSAGAGGSLPAEVPLTIALQPEQPDSTPASPAEPLGSSRGRQRFLRHVRPSGRPEAPAPPRGPGRHRPFLPGFSDASRGDAEACAGSWVEGSHRLLFLLSPLSLGELPPRFASGTPPQEPQTHSLALPRPEAFGALSY